MSRQRIAKEKIKMKKQIRQNFKLIVRYMPNFGAKLMFLIYFFEKTKFVYKITVKYHLFKSCLVRVIVSIYFFKFFQLIELHLT